jgi:hypothetical protein
MRLTTLAPLALLLALGAPLRAQKADTARTHREAVARLMEVTHVRQIVEQSSETMLNAQIEQMPQLAPYANVFREFYQEQLAWDVLEPEYTQLYLDVFTEKELRDMITFYESPLGQAMLAKMPVLMQKSSALTAARVQAAMPKLMERLQRAMQAPAAPQGPATTSTKKP